MVRTFAASRVPECSFQPLVRPNIILAAWVSRVAQRLVVFTPSAEDIDSVTARARGDGGAPPTEVVHRVFRHNPDSGDRAPRAFLAGIARAGSFLAFLMLNQAGMDRLFDGTLVATILICPALPSGTKRLSGSTGGACTRRAPCAGAAFHSAYEGCTPRYQTLRSLYPRRDGKRRPRL